MDHLHLTHAVIASDRLAENRADRHNVYPLRPNRDELRARADLYPVTGRRVQAVQINPPIDPRPAA